MGNFWKSKAKVYNKKPLKNSKLWLSISIENEDRKEQNEEHECEKNEEPETQSEPESEPDCDVEEWVQNTYCFVILKARRHIIEIKNLMTDCTNLIVVISF